jgi:hypothetical protein
MEHYDALIQVLDVLSDPKACIILGRTYGSNDDGIAGHVIAKQANLGPAGFYRLMSALREQNLIEKRNQRYFITFLGIAAYNAKMLVQKALDNYHRLKVIDSLKEQDQIPPSEINKIIDVFIEDYQLKHNLKTWRAED